MSASASRTVVTASGEVIEIHLRRLGGMELDATILPRASRSHELALWELEVDNRAVLRVTEVELPYVVCPYSPGGRSGTEALLWPFGGGL